MFQWASTIFCSGAVLVSYILWKRIVKLEERLAYQKRYHKPDLIILMRHGESEANIDPDKYGSIGDPNIQLTATGIDQVLQMITHKTHFQMFSSYFLAGNPSNPPTSNDYRQSASFQLQLAICQN